MAAAVLPFVPKQRCGCRSVPNIEQNPALLSQTKQQKLTNYEHRCVCSAVAKFGNEQLCGCSAVANLSDAALWLQWRCPLRQNSAVTYVQWLR